MSQVLSVKATGVSTRTKCTRQRRGSQLLPLGSKRSPLAVVQGSLGTCRRDGELPGVSRLGLVHGVIELFPRHARVRRAVLVQPGLAGAAQVVSVDHTLGLFPVEFGVRGGISDRTLTVFADDALRVVALGVLEPGGATHDE